MIWYPFYEVEERRSFSTTLGTHPPDAAYVVLSHRTAIGVSRLRTGGSVSPGRGGRTGGVSR